MDKSELNATAQAMMPAGKGLLAMDESNPTCHKRFAKLGIPQTVEARRAWRELILTTPRLGESISGAILFDETIRQAKNDGTPFVRLLTDAGIVPGIKVDAGAKDLAGHPGEKVTEGLDGLRSACRNTGSWGPIRQVAGGNHYRRPYSQPWMPGSQRPRPGTLCRSVSGSRAGSDRRAGGAHGRRPHPATMRRVTEATLHAVFANFSSSESAWKP